MRHHLLLLLLATLLAPAPAGASAADAYQAARLEYFSLRKDEKRKPYRHHWMRVIRGLDRGAEKLRGDARCGALFNAGRAWHEVSEISYLQDDREEAIRRYLRLAEICPRSSLADDALLHAAQLQQRRDERAAAATLDRLLAAHAGGDRAADARALRATLPPPRQEAKAKAPSQAKAKSAKQKFAAKQDAPSAPANAAGREATSAKKTAAAKRSASPQAGSKEKAKRARQNVAARQEAPARPAAPASGAPTAEPSPAAASAAKRANTPAPHAADEKPGSRLPSAADILAALDARGADANRPEDVALAEDLRRDRLARSAPAEKLDRAVVARLADATGGEVPLSVAAGLKVRRVVIDPGHGGKDTGAIGKKGTREKNLTLEISKRLRKHLEAMGLEVHLTRETDVFLELEERTAFANAKNADLFISVHINAAENRRAHGIETYTLNVNSDRYAMRLAARENATSRRGVGDLEFILADLATKANTDDSVRLAREVQGEMVSRLRRTWGKDAIRDLGVKQALFYVLVGARMPAILVEASFVSNPDEEKRLRTARYQEEVARGIAEGVRRFLDEREAIAQGKLPAGGGVF